jgi:hypothetical protein
MIDLVMTLRCECGATVPGIIVKLARRGGQAPVICPSCQKVHLTVGWDKSFPTTYALDLRDEVPQLERVKDPPDDPS